MNSKILFCLLITALLFVSSCSNCSRKNKNIDYSEIDSIAKVDAKNFVYAVSAKLTEMQIEDEILKIKSKNYSISQSYNPDFADRYNKTFKVSVKELNDSAYKFLVE